MLALATIIKRSDGSVAVSSSGLFSPPPDLMDAPRLDSYLKISTPGWHPQELGYWTYARQHENGDLYIYPALLISGKSKPRKRYPNYDKSFTQSQIELYAEDVESQSTVFQKEITEEFNFLVHDLRQLSTSIHHATEEAFGLLSEYKYPLVNERLQNISAMQQMLSIRTDLLDYTGNAQYYTEYRDIAAYKKIDKVVRSFGAYAATKSINLHLEGPSTRRTNGPDVLEIVPYVILDNAIKYSPRGNDITISVRDAERFLCLEVQSAGPVISPQERKKIFERGIRGAEAKASGIRGSGSGLFIAKRVVEQFNGKIEVKTSDSLFIDDDVKLTDVTFTVMLPISS